MWPSTYMNSPEGRDVEMDQRWAKSWGTQASHHIDPHPCAAQPRLAFSAGNRHIWVCHGSHIIPAVWRWQVASGRVHIKVPLWCQEEIWIHDKKLLSVIKGLEEWRHILEGISHMIEILNNHRNLTNFWMSHNLNYCSGLIHGFQGKVLRISWLMVCFTSKWSSWKDNVWMLARYDKVAYSHNDLDLHPDIWS